MLDMPEIKANMLLELQGGAYLMIARVAVPGRVYNAYRLKSSDEEVRLVQCEALSLSDIEWGVRRIYGVVAGSDYAPLNVYELRGILEHGSLWASRLLWTRPAVKEVTMTEVCEKFGCEVKIVEG